MQEGELPRRISVPSDKIHESQESDTDGEWIWSQINPRCLALLGVNPLRVGLLAQFAKPNLINRQILFSQSLAGHTARTIVYSCTELSTSRPE